MTSIDLTDKEKDVFLTWLGQREKMIYDEIELLKSIRSKLNKKVVITNEAESKTVHEPASKKASSDTEDNGISWVNIIKKELQHLSHPVQSGEIVKRLLQKPSLEKKGKRFITKAVTSKLWLLQERGEVIKTSENGRNVYALKK